MNRKETLIETLRGSVEALEGARDAFEACDIHDETGIVDSDFLIKMLEGLASLKAAECSVMKAINKMLGVSDEQQDTSKGSDTGKKISPEEVLRKCELKDNVVHLPNVQLKKETYAEVKKRIEEAGGKWAGGGEKKSRDSHSMSMRNGCSNCLKRKDGATWHRSSSSSKRPKRPQTGLFPSWVAYYQG